MTRDTRFDGLAYPRSESKGRTYVYVLPCRGEDLVKVGFSRDPLQRFHTLHRRFFNFFDLEAGLLIETEHLREARRIERLFIEKWSEHQAPAPMAIAKSAGGHTEWFRGIQDFVDDFAVRLATRYDHKVHVPLRTWMAERFLERSSVLYEWSMRLLDLIADHAMYSSSETKTNIYTIALRDALEACVAVGMDLPSLVPGTVLDWYER